MGNAAWTGTELLRQRIEGLLAHLFRLGDGQTWHDGPRLSGGQPLQHVSCIF